jgi:hypothetical protein
LNWWKGFKGKNGEKRGQFCPSRLAETKGEHSSETFLFGNKYLAGIIELWLMVYGVSNGFGLQMDLDPPLEGGFKRLKKKIKLWGLFF